MNAKRKVIIDCDPGIDDALALMLAVASPELEVLGITIVSGNVPVKEGAENALKVLRLMNRLDIPVYLGENTPLKRAYISAQDTHGMDGLGETNYAAVNEVRPKAGAVKFICEALYQDEKVSIIALGPLTNIAKGLQQDREAFKRLDEFISMGGNYRSHGNCSPVAEYNYWCDPHGAREVYEKLDKRIHMVGLDVTRKIVLTPNILEYMQRLDPHKGEFVKNITGFYYDFHWKHEGIIGCVINDPLAVAYFINRELCSGFEAFTTIETEGISMGQTIVDTMGFWKKKENSYVLTEVDHHEFMKIFLAKVFGADKAEVGSVLEEILK
ncbi:MAG: nucleoside hydrolase [Firmicutes bacterium]|nr:nucleoside hydrolase [Bacillota bacterium]